MEPENTEEAFYEGGIFFKPSFGTAEWEGLPQSLSIGSIITDRVVHQAHFGVFVDAGLGFPVLMDIASFGFRGIRFPDDYPALNSELTGQLVGFHYPEIYVIPVSPSEATYQ